MAGPAKKRAQADKQPSGSSNGSSSESRDPTQRSVPKSIPRLDGNRDPSIKAVVDYANPNDLKNISDFLGLGGWYAARGVSKTTILLSPRMHHTHCLADTSSVPPHRRTCKQPRLLNPPISARCEAGVVSIEGLIPSFRGYLVFITPIIIISKVSFGSCHLFVQKSVPIPSSFGYPHPSASS